LDEIYDYEERLRRYRRIIAGFGANGETTLRFLNHLDSLGLTTARISKYACHIPDHQAEILDTILSDIKAEDVAETVRFHIEQVMRARQRKTTVTDEKTSPTTKQEDVEPTKKTELTEYRLEADEQTGSLVEQKQTEGVR
jgi:hypothetical protein